MVKVCRYFSVLTIETNNFAFEIKVTLDIESNCPVHCMYKTELDNPT